MTRPRSQRDRSRDPRALKKKSGTSASTIEAKPIAKARQCGDCNTCCTLFEIPEVEKPLNARCRHQSSDADRPGCGIYEQRPEVCRAFECAWKLGLGAEHDRPDRLGIMLYTVNLEDGLPGLAIVESTPGAFETKRVRELIALYQKRKPGRIIVRRAPDRRFKQASLLINGTPLETAPKVVVPAAKQEQHLAARI